MSEKSRFALLGESGKGLPRAVLLIGGLVLGIILLVMGNISPAAEEQESAVAVSDNMETYARALEERIRIFCEQVEGVGVASVAVSLESGYRRIYAQEDSSYVLVGSGSSRGAVHLTDEPPKIGGIAVVCTGGGDPSVRQRLIGLLSAAYGIGSNKIYIAQAQK